MTPPDPQGAETRVEYGVACAMETYWPRWDSWLARFQLGRWLLAHWLAWDCDPSMDDFYGCGPHRVVRRTIPPHAGEETKG